MEVRISEEMMKPENKMKLEKALLTAFNKAVKKSQEIAAEKCEMLWETWGCRNGRWN